MVSLNTMKLSKLLLFLIVPIFVWFKLSQCWTHRRIKTQENYSCSFTDISACQMPHMENRTFLYIIWGGAGFCSELNQILLAFAYSVSTKRQFLIDIQQWNYGNFEDYFHFPLAKYHSQLNRTFLVESNHQNDLINHLQTTRVGAQVHKFWKATRPVQSIEIKRRVAHYLWKSMSNETLKFLESCQIRHVSNYIGIHLRRGDKLLKEAREIPLQKYIKTIETLLHTTNKIEHIFVASDDRTVVEELRRLKPTWNFFSIYNNSNHQRTNKTGHFQYQFNRLRSQEKVIQTRLFMCELQMLIDSQYVLCGMSSNVCRLIQTLRSQPVSTTISLDRSWYAT